MSWFKLDRQKSKSKSSSLNRQEKKREGPQRFSWRKMLEFWLGKQKSKQGPKKSEKPSWRQPFILEEMITPSVPWDLGDRLSELLSLDLDVPVDIDIASADLDIPDVTPIEDFIDEELGLPGPAEEDPLFCPVDPTDPTYLDPTDPGEPQPEPQPQPEPPSNVDTDYPGAIVPVDPPNDTPQGSDNGNGNGNGSNSDPEPEDEPPGPNETPVISNPVGDLVLTPTNPTENIDLSSIFSDPEDSSLTYEVIAGDNENVTVNIEGDLLEITALPGTGTTQIGIQATDEAGNSVIHSFDVTTELPEPVNETPVISNPVDNVVLTPTNPTESIDLSSIFSDPENSDLTYEVIAGDSENVTVNIEGDRLNITASDEAGTSQVTIQATDEAGNSVIHSFDVTTEPDETPVISNPVSDVVLTPTNPTESIDLSSIFSDPENSDLTYEVIAGDSENVTVNIEGDRLNITALPGTGTTQIGIQATDEAGNSVIDSFDVTTSNLNQESVEELDNALDDLTAVLNENPEDLLTGLVSPGGEAALDRVEEIIAETPDIIQVLTEPETLSELGFDEEGIAGVQELLDSPEVGELLGLPVSVNEALNDPNSETWDEFLINAPEDAIALLSEDADLPAVGFLDDFTDGHGENVTETFESINPKGSYDNIQVSDGNWAEQLNKFVDNLKNQGHDRGIANLSFDLSQVDEAGRETTRYELTPDEWQAIQYARDNNVLLVVASGNTGDRMSALGAAAQEFDNIIAVGAVNSWEEATSYSSRGDGLTLVAPGGEYKDDPDAFVGTSKAASYVTGAASMVWGENPELNYQQVKDILTETAKDLGPEGWDGDTGAGLLDVVEAMLMAAWVAPEPLVIDEEEEEKTSFSGAGRVTPSQRAASAATEAEISKIQNNQQNLLAQLALLSEGSTTEEIETAVNERRDKALEDYRQLTTAAEIAKSQDRNLTEARDLATNHYLIEQSRLQALLARQQELKELLAQLQQNKVDLQNANAQQLDAVKEAIAQTDRDLADARDKLQYQLVDPETLLAEPAAVRTAAADRAQLAAENSSQAQNLAAQAQQYQDLARQIEDASWRHQIVGYKRKRSGRSRPIWGWRQDPEQLKLRDQNQWQADIFSQNSAILAQLAAQQEQLATMLNDHADLLERNNQSLANLQGDPSDAAKVLQALKEQAAEQTELAARYWQQAELAERRRQQNQDTADWHDSRIKGQGNQHIPPRDQALEQVSQAEQERHANEQLARQAQQLADALNQQAQSLEERISDWPVLEQGIKHEITSDALKLQAERDLQALQGPIGQQQLEQLELQISQAETELHQLETSQLPGQQSKVTATETRLNEINAEAEPLKEGKQGQNLQNFLETYGFLLPYQERRAAFNKQLQDLTDEEIRVQELILQLSQQLTGTTDPQLQTQLEEARQYLQDIAESKEWAQVQLEQLNLSAPDSPQQLEIESLISDLSQRAEAQVQTNTLPLPQYLDFLREVDRRNDDLLTGFDDLNSRSAIAQTEQVAAEGAKSRLEEEYRDLGLEKASLEGEITTHQKLIDLEDGKIAATESAIGGTEGTLTVRKEELAVVSAALAQKVGEINAQQQVIDDTLTQIGDTQAEISAKATAISQQQSALQGYQGEIASAYTVAQQHEQQRQQNQDAANHWNDQIQTWGITHYRSESYRYKSGKKWKTGWRQVPVYGWIYNPEAEANRDSYQAAANTSAQLRDDATAQAQQLEASLQPTIASTAENIEQLELEKQAQVELEARLQGQLSQQQGELQQFEGERQGIVDEANAIQSQIDATQLQLNSLNSQLNAQRQQRTDLAASLADLEGQLLDNEAHLADKYREMELIDRYLQQVQSEVSRLESRLELLNKADVLERDYQAASQDWYEAIATQIAATEALLATRQAGAGDRASLLSHKSQLGELETELTLKEQQQQQLQEEVVDTGQALDMTSLQLTTQELQLESLLERDTPLQSGEQYYYNLAQEERKNIWHWDGKAYIYNADAANAYRSYLQQASLLADERNEVWQKTEETQTRIAELTAQQATQESQLSEKQSQLTQTTRAVEELTTQAAAAQEAIAPLEEALAPLQTAEGGQRQAFREAIARSESKGAELAQTIREQKAALERAIGFGVLASESDMDFFGTQVEPKVFDFIEQLEQRSQDFQAQGQQLTQLIEDWQAEMAGTTDPVSSQALEDLITQTQATRDALLTWERENADAAELLSQRLEEAKAALKPLQQQQELELRNSLDGNEERLTALERLLSTENAVEKAIADDTVLGYAQLKDQVSEDITESLTAWTKQLLEGNQQTLELGESQQALSGGVDELISYIEEKLAEPHGEYNQTLASLRDSILTLGVVAPRYDELEQGKTTLTQEIEKLKQLIEQDAKLWEDIGPIVQRYGAESEQLEEYQKQQKQLEKFALDQFERYEEERKRHQEQADYWGSKISQFDEQAYLNYYHDVRNAVNRRSIPSGAYHYSRWGWRENRTPNPQAMLNRNEEQAKADEAAKKRDAFNEIAQKLNLSNPDLLTEPVSESQAIDIAKQILDKAPKKELESLNHADYDRFNTDKLPELTGEAREIVEPFLEIERIKKLSEDYDYFENPDNGSRYFFTGSKTWDAAQEEAEKVGGSLVTIRNQQEQDFLTQKVGRQRVWIGLNDIEQEGDWRWISGEPVTYTNFRPGQPNNSHGRQDVAEFNHPDSRSGQWNDYFHDSPRHGLVEVKIKELEEQQRAILENLVKWAVENNAHDQISDIVPHENEQIESLSHHLEEYNRLKNEQLAEEAKASELRQGWADAVNFDQEKIVSTEFDNKLIESVRADDNYTYNRYSIDGGKTWSNWQKNNFHSKADDIKFTEVDGKLYQVLRNPNNHVYVRRSDNGVDWNNWSDIGAGPVSGDFAADAIGDRLVVAVRHDNNQIYTRAINSENWQPWNHTNVPTIGDFNQEIIDGRIVQSYKGVDDRTYVRNSLDGVEWAEWSPIETARSQSDWRLENLPGVSQQSLVENPEDISEIEFGDKIVQSRTADTNVYTRHSSDGGETWTDWKHDRVYTLHSSDGGGTWTGWRLTGDRANSNVQLLTLKDKVFQVIKGTDNSAYIRHSSDGENWTGWLQLTSAFSGELEIDAIGDRLVFGVRGLHDNKIYTRYANNGTSWSGWLPPSSPIMTDILQEMVDDRLVQSYRGMDGEIYTRYSSDGANWSAWESLPDAIAPQDWRQEYLEQLADAPTHKLEPTRAEFGDRLVEAVRGPNDVIYGRTSTDGGESWRDWSSAHGHTKAPVEMVELNDKLFQVHRSPDNSVYIRNSVNGENWTGWGRLSGPILGDFQLDAIDNQLVLAIHGTDNKVYTRHATNGTSWSGWHTASTLAMTGVLQEAIDDKLVQSYRGLDDEIHTRYSRDGVNWTEWETLPEVIAPQDWRQEYLEQLADSDTHKLEPTRTEFGDRLVEAVRGPNNAIYGRTSTDGGENWSDWSYAHGHTNAPVEMVELDNKLFQVHRSPDNSVYIRNSVNGENWTGWSRLSGPILGDFQVDAIDNQLVLAIRSTDRKVYTRHATNGTSWSGWENGPTETLEDFSQEIIDGKLVQSYLGTDGHKYVRHSDDGSKWSEWATVDAALDQAQWGRDEFANVLGNSANLDLENVVSYDFQGHTLQLVRDAGDVNSDVYERTSADGGQTWTDWKYSHIRSNPDEIEMLATGDRLFQVVRHPNNIVYVRHTSDGQLWSGWIKTSNWGTTGDIQADIIDDELVLGVRHNGNNQVHTRAFDGSRWTGWESAEPTLQDIQQEVKDDRLIQTYRGYDDIPYTRHSTDGVEWTEWTPIDEVLATSEWEQAHLEEVKTVAENFNPKNIVRTSFENKLVEMSLAPDNYIYDRYSTDGGQTWTEWTQNQSYHAQEGTLQFFDVGDKLFQVHKNNNNNIYYRHSEDGVKWTGWNNADVGATEGDYRADVIGNALVISALHSNDLIYSRPIADGKEQPWSKSTVKTLADFHQEVIGDRLVQTYRGIDDLLYSRNSADGVDWTEWKAIDDLEATSAWEQENLDRVKAAGENLNPKNIVSTSFDNKLVEMSLAPDNYIYDRYSTDGGQTWTEWKQNQSYRGQEGTLQFFGVGDKLFQVHKNSNNQIYFRHSEDGVKWTGWNNANVGATEGDYQADIIGNTLVISALHSNDLIYSRPIADGQEKSITNSTVKTLSDFQQEVMGDRMVQSYRGIDDVVYTRHSTDGLEWTEWKPIDEVLTTSSWEQENLNNIILNGENIAFEDMDTVEFNGTTTQTARGPENKVYQRQSHDGGQTWTNWGYAHMHNQESTPRTFVLEDRVFQVVHNPNNHIYFRWTGDGRNWSSWSNVGGPSADVETNLINNRLVISQQNHNDRIYTRTVNDRGWTNWAIAPVASINGIQQTVDDGTIQQTYQGIDGKTYSRSSADGLSWSNWTETAITDSLQFEDIDTVEFNGTTTQTARGPENKVYQRQSHDGGQTWTNWGYAHMHNQESTPRTFVLDGQVVQIVHNPNNNIYTRFTINGRNWSGWGHIGSASAGIATTLIDDRLVLLQQNHNDRVYSRTVDGNRRWTHWEIAPVASVKGIQQEVRDGIIHQTYQGIDGKTYTRSSGDGLSWSPWTQTAIESDQWLLPPLDSEDIDTVEFNGTTTQTVRGPENKVYQRQSHDGGQTWTNWGYAHMHNQESTPRTFVLEDRVFQVVHNPNNHIYFRWTGDGRNWSGWSNVGGPSADIETTLINNRLVLLQQNHNDRVYTRTVDDQRWTDWEIAPVSTTQEVQQEVVGDRIVQSYRGIDDLLYTRNSADGLDWTEWMPVDEALDASAWEQENLDGVKTAAENLNPKNIVRTSFDNKLVEMSLAPDNNIYDRYSTDGGKTWTEWTQNQSYNALQGTLRFFQVGDKLFQVHKNSNNNIYFRHSEDGVKWTGWNNADVGATEGDYRADIIGNALVISALHSNDLIYTRPIVDGQEKSITNSTVKTLSDFQQEVVDHRIVQSYRGIDDVLYTRNSSDGLDWTDWTPIEAVQETSSWEQNHVPHVKSDFDAIALENLTTNEFKGKQIQTVRDDRGYVYHRHSSDGGNSWSDWQYANIHTQEDNARTLQVGDRLFHVWKHPNNTVYAYDSLDGENWRYRGAVGGPSEGDYGISVVEEEMVFVMRHASNDKIYTRTVNTQGMSNWDISPMATIDDIQQKVEDSTITQSALGTDNNLYTRSSTDGKNWTEWYSHDPKVRELEALKEEHIPQIVDDSATLLRPTLIENNPENGTAIDELQGEIGEHLEEYQSHISQLKAEEAQNSAQAAAAIVQADWYEQRAADHWERSRKNGPTWTEQRKTWKRGKSGKKKAHWVTITHVDHDWILWDTYTKYAQELREQGVNQLVATDDQSQEQERLQPLAEQWAKAQNAANAAEAPIDASRNLVEVLTATREQTPVVREQLQLLEELLPEIEQQLAAAREEARAYNEKVLAEWEEYDADGAELDGVLSDVLARRAELNRQSTEVQHQLAEIEGWVERQSVALEPEITQVLALQSQLKAQLEEVKNSQITGNTISPRSDTIGEGSDELQTKQAQLEQSLSLLETKAAVLTAQQTALTQKRTLLTAQNEVIIAEQRLLDAYLVSPDADTEVLEQQLADARAALAEAQRLAEQAQTSSQILTGPLQAVQDDLLAQNDAHLQAAKARQQILKDLLEATELNANYTLEAAQKQQEVNNLEFQILQRLQEVTAAGNQEAKHLLEVATQNDMATAAEIYYRDYTDVASDKRSSSAGGVGRAEDRLLADRYYQEMLKHRELQQRAQDQAEHFGQIRETAQEQLDGLQQQQEAAAETLQEINERITETQEQGAAKEEELAVAQARLDGITRIREQTEQTFVQLVSLEQLNLAQAQLEQEIAVQRQSEIEEAVAQRIEREVLELERQRKEARAKLEQLEQLQAEEDLRQAVNQARADVGADAIAGGSDPAQLQSQMAALLLGLQALEEKQPDLPDDVKALLAETEGDIYLALQGEEAKNINANLLKVTEKLIEQANQYKAAIAELEIEEQQDSQLLQLADFDLQAATRQFLEEIELGKTLEGEREQLNPLHIETLSKVAYAEQAVEISQELAKSSRKLLEDIIDKRKEERKSRKKAFWNDFLGTYALILDIIGTILMFTPLAPIGIGLKVAAGVIRGVQAAINGDWAGALYNIGMAVLTAAGVPAEYKIGFSTAYQAYRASEAGDSTLAFLYVVQGLANAIAAAEGLDAKWMEDAAFADKLMLTAAQISVTAYQGSQAIENGDLAGALSNIAGMAGTIGTNFANELQDVANGLLGEELAEGLFTGEEGTWFEIPGVGGVGFDELKKTVETAFIITDAAEEGGTNAWLSGINSVLGVWEEEIQDAADEYFYYEDVVAVARANKIRPEQIKKIELNGKTLYVAVDSNGNLAVLAEKGQAGFSDENKQKDNPPANTEDDRTGSTQEKDASHNQDTGVGGDTNINRPGETNSIDLAPPPPLEPFPKEEEPPTAVEGSSDDSSSYEGNVPSQETENEPSSNPENNLSSELPDYELPSYASTPPELDTPLIKRTPTLNTIADASTTGARLTLAGSGLVNIREYINGEKSAEDAIQDTARDVVVGSITNAATESLGGRGLTGGLKVGGVVDAVTTGVFSAYENYSDYQEGQVEGHQALANVAVDTAVGVTSGAAGALAGAAVGSVIPVVGTIVGGLVGFGVSYLVSDHIDKSGVADDAKKGLGGLFNNWF